MELHLNQANSSTNSGNKENLIDARKISIPAGKSNTVLFEDPGYYGRALEIRLPIEDDLSVDNRAFVVLPEKESLKALLISRGNFYLQRALNVDPRSPSLRRINT